MYVVAIGPFANRELETLRDAALRCDLNLRAFDKPAEAVAALPGFSEAPSGFFASRVPTISALSSWVRQSPELLNVPIVAMIEHPTEGRFREAFAAGADDALVGDDVGSLRDRLQTLRSVAPARNAVRASMRHGFALIAMADGPLRRWVGRTLRQAGFELAFAESAHEVAEATRLRPKLIVTSDEAKSCQAALDRLEHASSNDMPPAPRLQLEENAWQQPGDTKARLLFFADEAVVRASRIDTRRSARVLHEAICAFRMPGGPSPIYGLTHNISRTGLYVRTLSPASVGSELWIELRTALGVPVHLRGRVMWRRDANQTSATAPAGFGFEISPDQTPASDLRDWESAYEILCGSSQAMH